MDNSNWIDVKQSIIDEVASIKKSLYSSIKDDIINRLNREGIDRSRIEVIGNKIVFTPKNDDQFKQGKVYFDAVYKQIKSKTWLEPLI